MSSSDRQFIVLAYGLINARYLSSACRYRAPLTVMFYCASSYFTHAWRYVGNYGAMGLRCHHISPLHRSNGDAVFIVVIWYTANLRLTSTYFRKTTRLYASYARITHLLLYAYRQREDFARAAINDSGNSLYTWHMRYIQLC